MCVYVCVGVCVCVCVCEIVCVSIHDAVCVSLPVGARQRHQCPWRRDQEEQPCSLQGQQADTPPPGLPGGQQQDPHDCVRKSH